MGLLPALGVLATLVLAGSCGSGGVEPAICPDDVPSSCPDSAPSYAADVAPLLLRRCGACHTVGGMAAPMTFDTYQQVKDERIGILSQVHSCLMPPATQMQPTPEDRQILFAWIVCGAMNN